MHFRVGMFFYTQWILDVKELYDNDSDFAEIYNACGHSTFGKFHLMDGYLFKE